MINNNIFKKEWTKESAWLLGFILADGNIIINKKTRHYSLNFCQNTNDKELLILVKKLLKSNNKISDQKILDKRTNKYYNQSKLSIYSKDLIHSLQKLDIEQRKSKKEKYPNHLPDKYFWHFLRGYFDGDGSVFLIKNKYLRINFSGSENLLKIINNKIYKKLNINNGTIEENSNTGSLRYQSVNSCKKILIKIYENSNNLRLERKYKKFIGSTSSEERVLRGRLKVPS